MIEIAIHRYKLIEPEASVTVSVRDVRHFLRVKNEADGTKTEGVHRINH